MKEFQRVLNAFCSIYKRFPSAADLHNAPNHIWEGATPNEIRLFLLGIISTDSDLPIDHPSVFNHAFPYFLNWLQTVRFRVTNGNLAKISNAIGGTGLTAQSISRLRTGRRRITEDERKALLELYLLATGQRKQLKQEVLNSNG
jgi:hypothetical protein